MTLLQRAAGVAELEVDSEVVLWKDGVLHRLNPMAAAAWRALAVATSPNQIVQVVADEFGQDPAQVSAASHALLEQLRTAGLVKEVGS